jgi:hypothetical protein
VILVLNLELKPFSNQHLIFPSLESIIGEMISCDRSFYSMPRILRRVWGNLWQRRKPLISLVGKFSYRNNLRLNRKAYADFKRQRAIGTIE